MVGQRSPIFIGSAWAQSASAKTKPPFLEPAETIASTAPETEALHGQGTFDPTQPQPKPENLQAGILQPSVSLACEQCRGSAFRDNHCFHRCTNRGLGGDAIREANRETVTELNWEHNSDVMRDHTEPAIPSARSLSRLCILFSSSQIFKVPMGLTPAMPRGSAEVISARRRQAKITPGVSLSHPAGCERLTPGVQNENGCRFIRLN